MYLRRLRAGEWLAALSGLALLVVLFLPWYEVSGRRLVVGGELGVGDTLDVTALQAFGLVDLLLIVVAVSALGLLVLIATQPTAASGIAAAALLTPVAGAAAVAVLIRVSNLPGDLETQAGGIAQTGRTAWAWVGVGATFGVLLGSLLSMRDERLSKPGRRTDSTGLPVAEKPRIETLRAPRGPSHTIAADDRP